MADNNWAIPHLLCYYNLDSLIPSCPFSSSSTTTWRHLLFRKSTTSNRVCSHLML